MRPVKRYFTEFTPTTPPAAPKATHSSSFTISIAPPTFRVTSDISSGSIIYSRPHSAPAESPLCRLSLPAVCPATKQESAIATMETAPESASAESVSSRNIAPTADSIKVVA